MMAAMGQQDCGQCGYNCKDYADALFSKKEERLNLCVPGGKETARMLKTLHAEIGAASAPAAESAGAPRPLRRAAARPAGRRATIPVEATFVSRTLLNKKGSAKETWHIEFDLTECGLDYHGRRCVRALSAQRSGAGRRGARGARRAGRFPDRRPHACARC